jgi:hypothetical protein
MLLDHRHDVASELQAGWRDEASVARAVRGERQVTVEEERRRAGIGSIGRTLTAMFHTPHPHLSFHGHAVPRGR